MAGSLPQLEHGWQFRHGPGGRRFWLSARAFVFENSGPCSMEPLAIRDMRRVVNGERTTVSCLQSLDRSFRSLTSDRDTVRTEGGNGAPSRRVGEHAMRNRSGPISPRLTGLTRMQSRTARKQAFRGWVKRRSGTISESVRLLRGADEGTIAMRIEYLAAIATAAFAAGGLAVPSVGSLPPEKSPRLPPPNWRPC